jgi:excinuclease UvrABC nuclease subunit
MRLWDWIDGLPDRRWGGGVYALYRNGQLVYVGHTKNFRTRLHAHRRCFEFDRVKVAPIANRRERQRLERKLIGRLLPLENRAVPNMNANPRHFIKGR